MKNWKTTIAGAIGAAAITLQSLYANGDIDLKTAAMAVAVAILGYFAKDAGVIGAGK